METKPNALFDIATLRGALEARGPALIQQYDGHERLCASLQASGETPEGNVA
ncbi:hypothetical protein [Jeongeupia naejangsanensis]|uniref:Uncharacterized protein n=1 Tax=Jeongeupia naejangsanensis TaxID=613195 RepID=A0ABS2BM15_9NEIS|nr:hypothetical protein [Jeongeupia naejangsanensis]MBM3116031.1 hypothetical protein [Jeongeupia naejangsanensis]